MRYLGRTIITRIIVGLVIGMVMFYFRQAHAQTCPPPKQPSGVEITSRGGNVAGFNINSLPAPGTRFSSASSAVAALRAVTPAGQPCSTGGSWENRTPAANSASAACVVGRGEVSILWSNVCADPACVAYNNGEIRILSGPSPTGDIPASVCQSNCLFNPSGEASYGIAANASNPDGAYSGSYRATNVYCTPSPGQGTVSVALPTPSPEVCQSAQGNNVCVGGDLPQECIRVNGAISCTDSGGGVCTTPECQALATAVRNSDGSATAMRDASTPKAPNTGTPGERATPSMQYSLGQGVGSSRQTKPFDYFSPSIVATSYNGDGSIGDATRPATNTDPQENGNCGRTGQPACENNDELGQKCGGVGQPACSVKIDEAGTPSAVPDLGEEFSTTIIPAFDDALGGLQLPPEISAADSDLLDLLPGLNPMQCQSITLFSFMGKPIVFPGTAGCSFLEALKVLLAYFIAIATGYYLVSSFIRDLNARGSGATSS